MTRKRILSASLLLAILFVYSCKEKPQNQVVASVNGSPILLSELEKELALREKREAGTGTAPDDVEDQLNTMIDRKLMIAEAVKLKLSENEQFAETIKRFYEQTLIRDLIEAKNREWDGKLTVTDEEISREYKRKRYRVVIRATRVRDRKAAEEVMQKIRQGEYNSCDMVGPCYYDEVKLTPLENAFDMKVGESKVVPDNDGFVVITVQEKQKLDLPPLDSIRPQLRRAVLDQKRQKAMDEWLEYLKQSSNIKIDKNVVAEAAGE